MKSNQVQIELKFLYLAFRIFFIEKPYGAVMGDFRNIR